MQVDLQKCTGCGDCLDVCSNKAISLIAGRVVIDLDTCLDCGACAEICLLGAISQVEQAVVTIQNHPIEARETASPETSTSRRLTFWAGTTLAFAGREILPHLVDTLISALEKRLSQPADLTQTKSQPISTINRRRTGKVRRRQRAGWRSLSNN